MTEFKLWIIRICVAVIFVLICDMLVPKNFKNVCNIVLGVILIVVITSPVAKLFANGENFWDKVLKNNNFLDRSSIYINRQVMDVQNNNVNKLYTKQMSEQLKTALMKAFILKDVKVEITSRFNNQYEIDKINLEIVKRTGVSDSTGISNNNKNIQAVNQAVRIRLTNNIKKFTMAFLNVKESQIYIKLS